MYKFLTIILILFSFTPSKAQSELDWEDHFSYYQIQDIARSGSTFFVGAQNTVFIYNQTTSRVEKISSIQGLSSQNISKIHFSASYNLLFIGYETGLIDVYNLQTKNVFKLVDIPNKTGIPPSERRINDMLEDGDKLYLATNYGITVFRLNELKFGDTYFIGNAGANLQVNQLAIQYDNLYAATQAGLRYADKNNPNLIDFNEWNAINSIEYKGVALVDNQLLALTANNVLQKVLNNNITQQVNVNFDVVDFRVSNEQILLTGSQVIKVYNQNLNEVQNLNNFSTFSPQFTCAIYYNARFYTGDFNLGLLSFINAFDEPKYLSPLGPIRNDVFGLDAIANELWAVYGEYTGALDPYPLNQRGVSHLKDERWINIAYDDLQDTRVLVRPIINPKQTNQVFISSYVDGFLELVNNEIVFKYDENTANLPETLDPNGNTVMGDVRVNGLDFDSSGNLWGTISLVKNGLFKLTPSSGRLDFFDISEIIPNYFSGELGLSDLVIDQSNLIYFGSYANGLIGFNPASGQFAKVTGQESAGNLPEGNSVKTLALDNNNQLWIGTTLGLRVLFNPSSMFTNPDTSTSQIIILDEDGVAQELLAENSIQDIAVDGNNNKWIATEAGVFYVSANGQETIYHFTTDNSPLPSNSVTSIAIDPETAKVYIGTRSGLVAFRGTATKSQENFEQVRAYPNPVRPHYKGPVTIDGLMAGANVKITDISGNLVFETTAQGGSVQWDTRAFGKHAVASGVYIVMLTSADQLETKLAKIMIIR